MADSRLRIGLVINPIAGMGGPAGLKGSDGKRVQAAARAAGFDSEASERTLAALRSAGNAISRCRWFTAAGAMGESALLAVGITPERIAAANAVTSAEDTTTVVRQFQDWQADLILFVGGDGTARDVLDALDGSDGSDVPMLVLGLPAGVKMYSGVFITSPGIFGEVLNRLLDGGLVRSRMADVVDVDEAALRAGRLGTRHYGEMRVPDLGGYVQHTKVGGKEDEGLALLEIAADLRERIGDHAGPVVFGPGSTTLAVKEAVAEAGTLLGVDVLDAAGQMHLDIDAVQLARLAPPKSTLVVLSFIRGQGFLLGRGNQQFRAPWLSQLMPNALCVIATRSKLASLEDRPLIVDTGDADLDAALTGVMPVVCGFEDVLLRRVATHTDAG